MQQSAIDLLVIGNSDFQVATQLGLHRVTVTRWRLYNHVFQAALNRRRHEVWGTASDKIRQTLNKAVRVFRKQVKSDNETTAFRAARTLLQLAGSCAFVRPPKPETHPHDPAGILDIAARKMHIELHTTDPFNEQLTDEDRALALRRMHNKNAVDPVPVEEQVEDQP
jgi:hypothetical protein